MSAPFNTRELLARFEGDAAMLREVATDFLTRSAILEERLRAELVRGEAVGAGRTAHTLKGVIACFDRGLVFDFARQIKSRADEEDFAGALALLDALTEFVEDLRDHLRREVVPRRSGESPNPYPVAEPSVM